MAKKEQFRAKPKECMYCGNPATEREHVIPKSIFDVLDSQMITIPTCAMCNDDKKRYDDILRDFLALDMRAEQHVAAQTKFWGEFRRAVVNKQSELSKIISEGTDTGYRINPKNLLIEPIFTCDIDDGLDQALKYIVRGLTADKLKDRVDANADIRVSLLTREQATNVLNRMTEYGGVLGPFRKGNGIVDWVFQYSSPNHSVWLFCFYSGVFFLVSVQPSELDTLLEAFDEVVELPERELEALPTAVDPFD